MNNIKNLYFIIIGDTFLKYERSEGFVWSFQKFNHINNQKNTQKNSNFFKVAFVLHSLKTPCVIKITLSYKQTCK